jgi:hypothetical protein
MSKYSYYDYRGLIELGLVGEDPAVKILEDFEICPTSLASFVTVLFETVMRTVPDKKQIAYEERFHKALQILMRDRFEYDVTIKYPDDDEV